MYNHICTAVNCWAGDQGSGLINLEATSASCMQPWNGGDGTLHDVVSCQTCCDTHLGCVAAMLANDQNCYLKQMRSSASAIDVSLCATDALDLYVNATYPVVCSGLCPSCSLPSPPPPPPPPTTLFIRGERSQLVFGPDGTGCTLEYTMGLSPSLTSSCPINQLSGRRLFEGAQTMHESSPELVRTMTRVEVVSAFEVKLAQLEDRMAKIEAENMRLSAEVKSRE